MKRILPFLVCLVGLVVLGFVIASVTNAAVPSRSIQGAIQGGNFAADGATGGDFVSTSPAASASPTTCAINYSYSVTGGSIVTATNVLTSGCSQCITQVTFPFPFTFYGQSYTSAGVDDEGNIQFNSADTSFPSCPFPIAQIGPAIFPFWSGFEIGPDYCLGIYGQSCGIYTATSGSAPNRIFTIQWLGVLFGSNHETVDFEARLHEGTGVFDFVYGFGIMFGDYASIGIQDGGSQFVSYACHTSIQLDYTQVEWTPSGGPCATNTPTVTRTITNTPTRTPSPTTTRSPTATATENCGLEWRVTASQSVGQDSDLEGIASIAQNDIWAVGAGANLSLPLLEHWDGTQWAIASPTAPAGTSFRLESVSGIASNDVWTVGYYQTGGSGAHTLAMHWDGNSWNWIPTPNSAGSVNELTYVSALASNDVWAVGYWDYGTSTTHTLIEHWNGSVWNIVASPDVNGNGYLRGVVAVAGNNAWAVGNYEVSLGITQPLILRWDGSTWSQFPSPILTWGGSLQQVAAIGPNDMWAVGGLASTSSGYNDKTLTMHWDGTSWSVVSSPNIDPYDNHLWAVAADASNDVWAVGTYNPPSAQQPLTMHWDGSAWNIITTPDPNPNPLPSATPTSNYFLGVAMAAPNDVWAVGAYEDGAQFLTLAEHYSLEGCGSVTPSPTHTAAATPSFTRTATVTITPSCPQSWVTIPSLSPAGSTQLSGLEAISSNDIWTVGTDIGGSADGVLEHWDGTQWSNVPFVHPGFADTLGDVSANSSNDAWMVGWYEGSGSGTLTEHWNGAQWSHVDSPNGTGYYNALLSVSARAGNDVWAVGYQTINNSINQTLVLHWNGTAWSVVSSPNVNGNGLLRAVSAIAANDVWAVGTYLENSVSKPMVLHWDGTAWSVATIPTFSGVTALFGVVGISSNDVWVVGYTGNQTLTMHWDGSTWSIVPSPSVGTEANYLYGIDALASNDAWAVGMYRSSSEEQTLTMHWDGSAWNVVGSPSPNGGGAYLAVSMLAPNEVWAAGYTHVNTQTLTLTARYAPAGQCNTATPTPTGTVATATPTGTVTSVASSTSVATATASPTAQSGTTTATPIAMASPTECTVEFIDVPQGSNFYDYVRCLACLGIINGYADGTFRPNNNVTRGQLSKIVSNAAGFSDNQTVPMFEDVPAGSTFFQFVGRLASRGYVSGYPCGGPGEPCDNGNLPYFRLNNNATRAQISKIVSNAAGFGDPPGAQIFEDVPPGSTFYNYIQRLASRGVMSGYPCGGPGEPCGGGNKPYFRPGNNATRGQTSKIVAKTFFPGCQTARWQR